MPNQRLLVIGLDAAEPTLLRRWMADGSLPNLAAMEREGASGDLETFPGLADDAIWASFSTGTHPGKHGRYHNVQFEPGSGRKTYMDDKFLKVPPFWKRIGDEGKRVVVVDVPKTPLVAEVHGLQICDWRVHGVDGPTRSHPPEVAEKLVRRYGIDRNDIFSSGTALCKMTAIDAEQRKQLSGILSESIRHKTEFLTELMQAEPWDLFLAVFKECHCAGHQFWRELEGDDREEGYLKKTYQEIDAAIGSLVREAGTDTRVIVFSDLGMAANHPGEHLLDEVLIHLDGNPLQRVWKAVGNRKFGVARIDRWKGGISRRLDRRRQFRQVPHNEISGAVKLHPSTVGCAKKRAKLERQLRQLEDPVTGEALVEDLIWAKENFGGGASDHLPDLLVIWNRDLEIKDARMSSGTTVRAKVPNYRPGNHVPGGFFVSNLGRLGEPGTTDKPSIIDLAPTICSLLGLDPGGFDGAPIKAITAES